LLESLIGNRSVDNPQVEAPPRIIGRADMNVAVPKLVEVRVPHRELPAGMPRPEASIIDRNQSACAAAQLREIILRASCSGWRAVLDEDEHYAYAVGRR
jgi:hypothetical protein